jgi:hypothetical protein
LIKKKVTVKLVFGVIQVLLAFVAIILSVIIQVNPSNFQSTLNLSADAVNFYVLVMMAVGFVSAVGGLFLIYDWWES